jgi:alpha-glucan phosphorylase-like protein
VKIALPGRSVEAKVWQVNVGRIPLYLLDTDIEQNGPKDKTITYQLYGGDNEHRLKQEMLLGLGGVRLINKLKLDPMIYHLNEGHSSFSVLERVKTLMEIEGFDFKLACEIVRSSSLFTTHTPVPAGHDTFEEHLIRAYMAHFAEYFKIDWNEFMRLGRFNPSNQSEKFSMSVLATRLSQEVNGVSKIHGRVSREMMAPLYPGYFPQELHIGHVTNGVHYFTWTDNVWQQLYKSTFGTEFEKNQPDGRYWENIYNVPDEMIWKNRLILKSKLIENLKHKLKRDLTNRHENPKAMLNSMKNLNENTLVIGFARRFATYKRANLLFTNIERLSALVNNPEKPVIFLFSGKAHPNDNAGQDLIKKIIEISRLPQFEGRIIFLEDYDMIGGKLLTSCVDIWLNTPTRPLEASGTSGEKAVMNGVVNLSVLDGWWAEGYLSGAGWAIEEARTFSNQEFQNELDTEIIYNILEKEITPLYYSVNENGVPVEWVSYIKNTIARIAPRFTMQRMLEDYYLQFYSKLFASHNKMVENNYANAKSIVSWKNKIQQSWDKISVESLHVPDSNKGPIDFGKNFVAEISLKIPNLTSDDIGVEILMGNKIERGGDIETIALKQELDVISFENEIATYRCNFALKHAGVYDYAFRIHPKNHGLAHRMDFPLVKWV